MITTARWNADRTGFIALFGDGSSQWYPVSIVGDPASIAQWSPRASDVKAFLAGGGSVAAFNAQGLAHVQADADAAIDLKAEQVRLRYITAGAGQAGTYILKAQQADSFKAAGYPPASVPALIQAEANATGSTAQQAADSIIAQRNQWVLKAAQIEQARRYGKIQVDAATTAAAVIAARDSAIASLEGM